MEAIQVSFLREVLEIQRLAFRIEGPPEDLQRLHGDRAGGCL